MIDEMGIFRTTVELAPWQDHTKRQQLRSVMVDTGSEYTWIPRELLEELGVKPARTERFDKADGRILEREIGFAMVFAASRSSPTIVVFVGNRGISSPQTHYSVPYISVMIRLSAAASSSESLPSFAPIRALLIVRI